ncbi:MAG TPA: translocation/assembly module TamB domain-containing protein, partial [Afifellaceae bacterium]|nr:translocation/assembly module TamB domain-containing protein [Afifellaceae bacterium]
DWTLQGQVAAFGGMGYSGETLELSATGKSSNFSRGMIPFQATATAERLAVPDPRAAPYLAGPLRIAASGTWKDGLLALDGAEAASAVAMLKVLGTIDAGAGSLDLDIQASADTAVDPRLPPLLGNGRVSLAGKVARSSAGRLSVSNASVVAAALSATGNLTLDGDALTADAVLTAPDLSHFRSELSGSANMTIKAEGPLTAPNFVIAAQGKTIRLRGKDLADPKLAFQGVLSAALPSGKLFGSATLAGKPVEASARITSTAQGERLAEDIRISAGEAVVEGELSAPAGGKPAGRFRFSIPDLAEIAPLLLRDDLSGAVEGTIALGERQGRLAVDLAANAPRAGLAGLILTDGRLDAVILDPFGAPLIDGRFESSRLEAGGAIVEALTVKAEHAGAATAFNATATANGKPVLAAGKLETRNGQTVIALDSGKAQYRGIDASLTAPARLTIEDGTVRIDRAALGVAGGSAVVSGSIGETLALEVSLASVPASIAETFSPGLGLSGAISGTVSLSGPASSPRVPFKITWNDASAEASRSAGLPALAVSADGAYENKAVNVQSKLSGSGLDLVVFGRVGVAGRVDMDLAMRGTVPLEIAATRLADSGMRLDGAAGIDIALKGTPGTPEISGEISASSVTFIDTRSAIVVKNIASRIALSGSQARIESLTGTLGSKGAVAVSGTIEVLPQDGFPADLSIQLGNANYADGRILSAAFNAALTLNGPLANEPFLGGRIDIARADIQVPDRLPGGSVSAIAVGHVNAPADVRRQAETLKPQQAGGAPSSNLGLNLTVSAPRQIFVRGRGLDAELGGQVRLEGSAAAPRAIGAFNLIRGRLNILTRRLVMSRGTVTFAGS